MGINWHPVSISPKTYRKNNLTTFLSYIKTYFVTQLSQFSTNVRENCAKLRWCLWKVEKTKALHIFCLWSPSKVCYYVVTDWILQFESWYKKKIANFLRFNINVKPQLQWQSDDKQGCVFVHVLQIVLGSNNIIRFSNCS